ncbi:transglycosylase SLT domain-containing protein, partial [Burkholderia arboris]|uniref:transglycosylase SLT domain-containing protein n=1 Tax=Burkholderia arboris TaxID=488730 RepID=UPI001CF3B2A0
SSEIDKVDPAIEATKEIGRLARAPAALATTAVKATIGRAFNPNRGRDRADSGWLIRIWSELRLSRRQTGVMEQAQTRILKSIDKKSGIRRGSGLLALLAGLLPFLRRLLPFGGLPRNPLPKVPGGGRPGGKAPPGTVDKGKPSGKPGTPSSDRPGQGGKPTEPKTNPKANPTKVGGALKKLGKLGKFGAALTGLAGFFPLSAKVGAALMTYSEDLNKGERETLEQLQPKEGDEWTPEMAKPVAEAPLDTGAAEVVGPPSALRSGINYLAGALNRKYRHRTKFSGFQGAEGMSKYGTYTNDEINTINYLKASGANTSAHLKSGMPREIQEKIIARSLAWGNAPQEMLKIAAMEGGGNKNAISSTGAIGLFQITGRTATALGVKDRFDVDQNIEGAMKHVALDRAALRKAGLPVTPENLYMMFQLGPVAKEVIRGAQDGKRIDQLSSDARKAIGLNYGNRSSTAADYIATNKKALNQRYNQVVGRSDAGILPIPSSGASRSVPASFARGTSAFSFSAQAEVGKASPKVSPPMFTLPTRPAVSPMPEIRIPVPLSSGVPLQVTVISEPKVTQDVTDRRIAHIATGGVAGR